MTAECGVAAVVIAGVQPDRELLAAFGVAGVKPGVSPFVGQDAVKSLHLAVGLRPVRAGAPVLDAAKCVAEGMRAVAGAVVGQHFPHRDAALGEPGVGP